MLILASGSPRRNDLLKLLRKPFEVHASHAEEVAEEFSDDPASVAVENARRKAQDVARKFPNDTVIGADTIVVLGKKIFGKPKDQADAVEMLSELQNQTHEVITGLTVIRGEKILTAVEKTFVTFAEIPRDEIVSYVETGEPMDKSGSYAIQGGIAPYTLKIDGSWSNVVGLPLYRLRMMLIELEK